MKIISRNVIAIIIIIIIIMGLESVSASEDVIGDLVASAVCF